MRTRANVPGFRIAWPLGTSASNGNASVGVLTAGLQRRVIACLLRWQHGVRSVQRLLRHELAPVQLVGAVVALLRLYELGLRFLDVGRLLDRRQVRRVRRAVLRERARERGFLLIEVVLRLFAIELD